MAESVFLSDREVHAGSFEAGGIIARGLYSREKTIGGLMLIKQVWLLSADGFLQTDSD